jgi:aldehyde dehydrogenase (NAD+)
MDIKTYINQLGISTATNAGTWIGEKSLWNEKVIHSYSPTDGKKIGSVSVTTKNEYEDVVNNAIKAFELWKL